MGNDEGGDVGADVGGGTVGLAVGEFVSPGWVGREVIGERVGNDDGVLDGTPLG